MGPTLAKLVAYEVQTYQRGDWQIDSIVDDRQSAMDSAQQFQRSKHCAGVRVVEEVHDEDSQRTATKIIFRHTKADGGQPAPQRAKQAPAQRRPTAKPKPGDAKVPTYRAPAPKRDNSTTWAVAVLVVLGAAVAVGYYMTTNS